MIRRAFLLGLYSIVGQVLLLRELVASLNGDELFISTALFGWLISVAVGAYLGGRQRSAPHSLFWRAAVLLPVMILLVRFSPMLTNHMVGEVIPFTQAALISIIAMLPVGLISGWLFPSIARQQMETQQSIIRVYLFEGLGAFLGGLVVAFAIGPWLSGLQLAVVVGVLVAFVEWVLTVPTWNFRLRRALLMVVVVATCIVGFGYLEPMSDGWRFKPYQVEKSFDTHYGRQTILSRESELVLLTDNSIEAVYPSVMEAENALIPALMYHHHEREQYCLHRQGKVRCGATGREYRCTLSDGHRSPSRVERGDRWYHINRPPPGTSVHGCRNYERADSERTLDVRYRNYQPRDI